MRKFVVALALLGSLSTASLSSFAETRYISDEMAVPLRRGPSTGHKILHRGLPSGTPLEVVAEDRAAGFTQVRLANGTEGWLESQYLVNQPVAKERLAAATRRIESLEAQLKSTRESFQEQRGARTQVEGRAGDLTKQNEKLQAELAEIRRVSATAITQYEENKQLKASNESLQAQVTQLTGRVRELERNIMLRWLLAGGALVLLGLVLGAWIKSRPKRSTWA
jgi:SH3 domain protein